MTDMKAIIVDDDIPTTQVIRESVDWKANAIVKVFVAYNIEKAKKIILEHLPEIIICDIEMPKGSGIDLIKWVRENQINSRFIFLTCHEEFYYASEAIRYAADAYVTKPFDVKSMQDIIAAVTDKINDQNKLNQYKDYGERWMSNLQTRENSFWRDLLFGSIPPEGREIRRAIEERGIDCDPSRRHQLLLCSVRVSQVEDRSLEKSSFRASLGRLVNNILSGSPELERTIDYMANGSIYVIKVMPETDPSPLLMNKGEMLIHMCKRSLNSELTCYIGRPATVEMLMASRISLEDADAYNLSKRGRVLSSLEEMVEQRGSYAFDSKPIEKLINEERGVEAVNLLREELEKLASQEKLNGEIMQRIQHDYLQIIYSILYANNIQAHELFSDEASQKLYHSSGFSVFDMMKWASYITAKTFQQINNVRETESMVNKLKRFIAENYNKKLSREDIAAAVFLSPDYVSKIFHLETGQYIKDYLNDIRISKAKQLIREGKMNVGEVAAFVGYENFPYFSSLFKKSTGVSPSEFRKRESSTR